MKKLIAKVELVDGFGNPSTLKVFTDHEVGTVGYSLTSPNTGVGFSISNLQCGWRGPNLPDNTYEYSTNEDLMEAVYAAIKGGVKKVVDSKLFVK